MNHPKLPDIGDFVRHCGRLIGIEEVPPRPQPPPEYIFEEISARCELRFNGEVIKELQELNDFYGLETSVSSAIKEMEEYAKKKGIGAGCDLEVVVIRIASQYRARPTSDAGFYDKTFYGFEPLQYGTKHDLPNPDETIVWTSRASQAQPQSA